MVPPWTARSKAGSDGPVLGQPWEEHHRFTWSRTSGLPPSLEPPRAGTFQQLQMHLDGLPVPNPESLCRGRDLSWEPPAALSLFCWQSLGFLVPGLGPKHRPFSPRLVLGRAAQCHQHRSGAAPNEGLSPRRWCSPCSQGHGTHLQPAKPNTPLGWAGHQPRRTPARPRGNLAGRARGPRARAAGTATDSPCPKEFTGKGTLPATVYTSA